MRVTASLLLFLFLFQQRDLSSVQVADAANDELVCPTISATFLGKNKVDTLDNIKRLREISGLAFSPTQVGPSGQPVFFAIGDGGSLERIFLFDSGTGKRLLTLQIDTNEFVNKDWEAMTIGSCGNSGVDDTCLYVMDGGDNAARTSGGRRSQRGAMSYAILKVREPNLSDFDDYDFIPKSHYSILEYDYQHPTSPVSFFDCETMILDHVGWGPDESIGDIYLVTKGQGKVQDVGATVYALNRLFKIPASVWPASKGATRATYSPRVVGSYDFTLKPNPGNVTDPELDKYIVDGGEIMGGQWRSGEMSKDGSLIGIGTVDYAYIFLRCPGVSVADTLAGKKASSRSCLQWAQPTGGQVESFAFSPNGLLSLEIPEGRKPNMGWTSFVYDSKKTSQRCPNKNLR